MTPMQTPQDSLPYTALRHEPARSQRPRARAAFEAELRLRDAVCLYVNAHGQVLRMMGRLDRFLRTCGTEAPDLRSLLPPHLSMAVFDGVRRAHDTGMPVSYARLTPGVSDAEAASVYIHPVPPDDKREPFCAVWLERPATTPLDHEARLTGLRTELRLTRENLQSIVEELGSAADAARATHEELLASREVLQRTHDHLRDARAELVDARPGIDTAIAEARAALADLAGDIDARGMGAVWIDDHLRVTRRTRRGEVLLEQGHLRDVVRQHVRDALPSFQIRDARGAAVTVRMLALPPGDRGHLLVCVREDCP